MCIYVRLTNDYVPFYTSAKKNLYVRFQSLIEIYIVINTKKNCMRNIQFSWNSLYSLNKC